MGEFRMPILGADMRAGRLVSWRKREGDPVHRGDIIAEVETDKGNIEVEVYEDGIVGRLLVAPGTEVPVGTPLALIESGREAGASPAPAPGAQATPSPGPAHPSPSVEPPAIAAPGAPGPAHRRASPRARRLAEARGLDLASLEGTGPGGAVTSADVARATASVPAPGQAPGQAPGMRAAIAAAMARSKREIPHYYVATPIDLGPASAWLAERNQVLPVAERILMAAVLLKAVALGLRDVPELNARWAGGSAPPAPDVHLGVAIALRGGGLVAPALHHADRCTVPELMARLGDLTQRARRGGLRSSELSDPTVTVTSLGEQGAETVFGVIYPPQVALVGLGRVSTRAWCVDGAVVARPLVHASLSADHRVTDGARGARFLDALARRLAEPERL